MTRLLALVTLLLLTSLSAVFGQSRPSAVAKGATSEDARDLILEWCKQNNLHVVVGSLDSVFAYGTLGTVIKAQQAIVYRFIPLSEGTQITMRQYADSTLEKEYATELNLMSQRRMLDAFADQVERVHLMRNAAAHPLNLQHPVVELGWTLDQLRTEVFAAKRERPELFVDSTVEGRITPRTASFLYSPVKRYNVDGASKILLEEPNKVTWNIWAASGMSKDDFEYIVKENEGRLGKGTFYSEFETSEYAYTGWHGYYWNLGEYTFSVTYDPSKSNTVKVQNWLNGVARH